MNRSNDIVEKHANMRAYLKHRERVLEVKSRIDNKRPRSKSVTRSNIKDSSETSKIREENLRLLSSLIQISKRKSGLGSYTPSSINRSKSCSRSSASSSSSTGIAMNLKR